MFTSDFAAAAVLITFGAVLGKLSPIQYVVLSFLEIIVFQVNEYIGLSKFKVNVITDYSSKKVVDFKHVYFLVQLLSVEDPGFPRRKFTNPRGGVNLLFDIIFYRKLYKHEKTENGVSLPWIRHWLFKRLYVMVQNLWIVVPALFSRVFHVYSPVN